MFSMKALGNVVSVLKFLASVAFFCGVGIASAWLAGTLTAVLSMPDPEAIRTGADLRAYPWTLISSILIYFFSCLSVFYAIILVMFVEDEKIDNSISQQLEYSFIILSMLSLFAITDVVGTVAKYRILTREESAKSSFAMFDMYRKLAIIECGKKKSQMALAGLWIESCRLVDMSEQMNEEPFNGALFAQFEDALRKVEASVRTDNDWDQGKLKLSAPTDVDLVPFVRLVTIDLDIMGKTLKDLNQEKKNIKNLGEYLPPDIFLILRFFSYYVLAYAVALRLARATAEASGLIKKATD